MKVAALLLIITVARATVSYAGFIDTKSQWDALPAQEKNGFVMGWTDASRTGVVGAESFNQYRADETECLIELGLTSKQLIEIIDHQYEELENWDKSASLMLAAGLRKVCLATINRMRVERGDTPFDN